MAIAFHIVNKPAAHAREKYATAWMRLDESGARHPVGRRSHTAWIEGDVVHVLDVWETQEDLDRFVTDHLGRLLSELGLDLAGPPLAAEFLQLVISNGYIDGPAAGAWMEGSAAAPR